jgi:hypothetical protein
MLGALVFTTALTTSLPAWAQATDPIAATELFKQGREAMGKGDHATACQKFDDSARLDLKVGTLLNLAECEEHLGKIASARQHLQRALDLAKAQGDDRVELARTRLAAIDKRVPRLTVTLASKVPGARIRRDDVDLGGGSIGSPLPVEPGEHVITVSAPRHEDRSFTVKLAEGEQQTLAVDVGAEAPADASSPAAASAESSQSSGSTKTLGFVTAGVGIAAIGAGTIFALIAMGDDSKSNETCDANNVCDPAGKDARDDARAAGNVATGFFIGGAVALATGVVLVLAAPSERKAARIVPLVSPSSAGLVVRGAF